LLFIPTCAATDWRAALMRKQNTLRDAVVGGC
jgi:hypothetical protein